MKKGIIISFASIIIASCFIIVGFCHGQKRNNYGFEGLLNIIWVHDDYVPNDIYNQTFSFRITEVNEEKISGNYAFGTCALAYPDFFYYRWTSRLGKFSGKRSGNSAVCYLDDTFSDIVHSEEEALFFTMELTGKERITVAFDSVNIYKSDVYSEKSIYRPYSFSDISGLISEDSYTDTALDSWGNVRLYTLQWSSNNCGGVLFTDEHDRILYKFNAPFQGDVYLTGVSIDDYNGDGLKDVKITTAIADITWLFFQRWDGVFYDSSLNLTKI